MKSTGIIRHIDDLGRVVVPREIRRTLNLQEGDPLELFVADEMLCLQKYYVEANYRARITNLIAGIAEDCHMENSAEIREKLNEVLELLGGQCGTDGQNHS